jgi:hypothetical protein
METGKEQITRLMEMLPEGWQAQAKALGALRRAREVKSAEDLLKLIVLYLTEGRSYAGTSAMLNITETMSMNKIAGVQTNTEQWRVAEAAVPGTIPAAGHDNRAA